MRRKEHCQIDEVVFGRPYDDVHKWLDSDAGHWFKSKYSIFNHWILNHHVDAIDVQCGVGTIESKVAKLHVVCDWLSHFGEWHLPIHGEAVAQILRSEGVKIVPRRLVVQDEALVHKRSSL